MMIYIILNNTGGAIMESLELRIFREVAYTKSISKTAENIHNPLRFLEFLWKYRSAKDFF